MKCGCGGEAYIFRGENRNWIFCVECHTESKPYETVEEAIEAWNRAMGAKDINVPNKERTAKVTDTWKISGFKELNAWCPECEHRITRGCSYCPTCGVKLEWK